MLHNLYINVRIAVILSPNLSLQDNQVRSQDFCGIILVKMDSENGFCYFSRKVSPQACMLLHKLYIKLGIPDNLSPSLFPYDLPGRSYKIPRNCKQPKVPTRRNIGTFGPHQILLESISLFRTIGTIVFPRENEVTYHFMHT